MNPTERLDELLEGTSLSAEWKFGYAGTLRRGEVGLKATIEDAGLQVVELLFAFIGPGELSIPISREVDDLALLFALIGGHHLLTGRQDGVLTASGLSSVLYLDALSGPILEHEFERLVSDGTQVLRELSKTSPRPPISKLGSLQSP
jgi:hypothetical protein